jgi:hypothetical protein
MKPWTTWLARLGIAGACFLVTGCGGGNVPDASSEGSAATESAPSAGGGGGAPAAPPAAVEGPKVAQTDRAPKTEEAPAEPPAATPAPEPEAPAAAPKAQGNSSTQEMLAMATGPGAGGSPPAAGAAPPADAAPTTPGGPGAGAPGAMARPGGPGGSPGLPGGGMGMAPGAPGAGGPPPMAPGGGGPPAGAMINPDQMNKMMAGRPGSPGPNTPGVPGAGAGDAGGAPVDNSPANLHTPEGAVRAFLNALRAKDLDRLNESTALRAQSEATTKNQDLFRKIYELTLSDSELDDLANKLEGYRLAGENPPKSTGRVEVILQKPGQNGAYFRRKITVRHERKGWGVLDVGGPQEFKSLSAMPRRKR